MTGVDGAAELARRVARLDAEAGGSAGVLGGFSKLEWAIWVTSEITPTESTSEPPESVQVRPDIADEVAATSRLLSSLRDVTPEIVTGPIDRERQYWIATGKPPGVTPAVRRLGQGHFVPAGPATSVSTKPFSVGLFTATGVQDTYGMWHLYLETNRSSLSPLPWHIWSVRPDDHARVLEIPSATAWARFVLTYPLRHDGLLYPDWNAAAADHDGVHMTLQAIVATQGLYLRTPPGLLAPTFWDVESTLWLRWVFPTTHLVTIQEQ